MKHIKKWLPLLCALFVILVPVSVSAADDVPSLPEDINDLGYDYYFYFRSDNLYLILQDDVPLYVEDIGGITYLITDDSVNSRIYSNGAWSELSIDSIYTSGAGNLVYDIDGAHIYNGYHLMSHREVSEVIGANYDVYQCIYDDDNACWNATSVFFKAPHPTLAPIAEQTNLSQVQNQILLLIPVVIVVMIGWLGLRKALALLGRVLHQA